MIAASPPPIPGLLSPEHVLARVTDDLTRRFDGIFAAETVTRYVTETHTELARTSRITAHLPVLTARFAADRLAALAKVEGAVVTGIPEVLFVCVHNAGRSQMAAALLERHGNGTVHVRSAGSTPTRDLEPAVLAAMAEIGLPLADAFPKPLTDEIVQAADVVITMGCGDACPVYPGKQYLDWHLADPAGQPLEQVRRIRDDLDTRVRQLLGHIRSSAAGIAP